MTDLEQPCSEKNYIIHKNDLPLSCPTNAMSLWNAHPKVYLSLDDNGIATCPYCSARYILEQA